MLLFPKLEVSKSEAILLSISLQKTLNEPTALLGSFTSVFLLIPLNPTLRSGLTQLFQSLHDEVFPYSQIQLSYFSPESSSLLCPSLQHGRSKEVTTQFPPRSAYGEGTADPTL